MLQPREKKIRVVAVLGALALIAGGASVLASQRPAPEGQGCSNDACALSGECVASPGLHCVQPQGQDCNNSTYC